MTELSLDARKVRRCSDPQSLGCRQEAEPRKQRCYECWLHAQPPVVRADAALKRANLVPEKYRRATVRKQEWPEGRRWCSGCQTFVRFVDVAGSRCKACASTANHKNAVASRFGIDAETYAWLLEKQLGKCAICRSRPKSVRMAVDHDHACTVCGGKDGCPSCVRGLLCSKCNHDLLGAAHDSVHILENAVTYLKTPPMGDEWSISEWERDQWREKYGDTEPAPF